MYANQTLSPFRERRTTKEGYTDRFFDAVFWQVVHDMSDAVSFQSILEAADVLQGIAQHTPVLSGTPLDDAVSSEVLLKCENFQRTGSFKFRGAYHALFQLKARGTARTVVTLSSGNHGQGVALAARLLGLKAHVVMPKPISLYKHACVSSHGATVWVADDRDAAQRLAQDIARDEQAAFVHAFNDPAVMAGQGTVMLELLNQAARLDVVLAPVGGGGLLSGLCVAAHHLQPAMKLFACEPAEAADAAESLRLNRVVPMPHPQTRADGLRSSLGDRTLPILRQHLAGVFLVTEAEILEAMRFAYERLKIVIEPSSAVALAPILRKESELIGQRIGVIITGGNADLDPLWARLAEPLA